MKDSKKQSIKSELEWSYSKSSGPGGQHVNTTDSKARLSWEFQSSPSLNSREKELLKKKLHHYVKSNGRLQLTDSSQRSRELNKKKCTQKLFHLMEKVAFKIEKKRIKTKPSRSSIEKRIKIKKQKSDTKKNRKKVSF